MKRINYPFTAIVGQEEMTLALVLNAISPAVGGVLIKGEKGTAKSTAVRALADILPPFDSDVEESMKVIELPVNATEDRVVGTIDIEHALKSGEKKFEPGLLAKANNNILYIDEINLLDDHVVDVLLDAAAMGINTVEREGISYSHPARFVLIGTMNPEEGDIRPQLLDRFGLSVTASGVKDKALRMEVIKRRIAFEEDKEGYLKQWEKEQNILRDKVLSARRLLKQVQIREEILQYIVAISIAMEVDGHRADLTMLQTAKALAAYEQTTIVTKKHLEQVAKLVLPHRMRRKPFEEQKFDWALIEDILAGQENE